MNGGAWKVETVLINTSVLSSTLSVFFEVTVTVRRHPGAPTVSHVEQALEFFDVQDYITNFVKRAEPQGLFSL